MQKFKKKVVIFGTFDVIHDGHRDLIRQAREYGAHLTVVVARDQTVTKIKGKKPRNNECLRYWTILQEEGVDAVQLGELGDKYTILEDLRPNVICIGYDQIDFVKDLGAELTNRGLHSTKVKKLDPYYPEQYKSSKLDNDENITARAKQFIRETVLQKNVNIHASEMTMISKKIFKKLQAIHSIEDAQHVSVFLSTGHEVETREFIQWLRKNNKTVLMPKLDKEGYMKMCLLSENKDITEKNVSFFEPCDCPRYEDKVDVCVMPCVACDEKGNRLGRGMGYYDKFLSMYECGQTVILAHEGQVVPCIPTEKFDEPANLIITEKRLIER